MRETQDLENALHEAQRECGQIVLIEAAAGLGKTSLLWSTYDAAVAMGFTCLRTRASELERDFPYGCMRRLLDPVLATASIVERQQLFADAAGLSLSLFDHSSASLPVAAEGPFATLHGLYWLLNNLARHQPIVLCIDDLQWADVESQRFLAYLAPRLDGLAVVVIATVRARQNVTPDLVRLLVQPEIKLLRPQPLSVEATAALCELQLGTKVANDFATACHGATGGNPFFLQTLLREAQELRFLTDANEAARVRRIGPAAVARAVLLRLSSTPPAATALVRAIAVLGDGASVVDAARLTELAADEAARMADLLVDLAILKRGEDIEFAHPIVRHAIYEDIGVHERARAHACAARMLAQRGAEDERIAAQILKSEPAGEVERVELLRRVAGRALIQGAPNAAIVWLQRALKEPPAPESRPEVLLDLGSAQLRVGMPEALAHLQEAMAAIRQSALLAHGARQLANALSMSGDAHGAIAALESAIEILEPENREFALILEAEAAAKAQQAGRLARAATAARLARRGELKGATAGERLVLATLAFERARASESEREAVHHIEGALASGGLFGQEPDVVGPFYALAIGLLATDALDLGYRTLEQALVEARLRGSIPGQAFVIAHRGWFSLRRGAVAQAEADARTALDLITAHDIQLGRYFAMALLVESLLAAGQVEAADETLRRSEIGAEIPLGLANINMLEARGLLHLAQGNTRAGLDDLLEYGRREELSGAANPLSSRWRSHACLALRALADDEGARNMAVEELQRARRWGSASGVGIALRAVALTAADTPSIDRLAEAVAVLDRSPARLEYARALTDLGAAQRRANRRAEARNTLERALKLARECGGQAVAERAAVELRASGGPSSDLSGSAVQQLTVSERRVAELAAKGHSNPQIAQMLFVTRKTVETHLGHIYSKLGISGRVALARALETP
jgi:DNA-binding CsgD family transcriptional regulator/dihydroxyacetone kinase DhaKLM complex PTS-EIIA-like component DhaM